MKISIGMDLKIKYKSVGVDNMKASGNKLHDYRELFNEKGYKMGEMESNILSATAPKLYSNHNGNNLKLKNNKTEIMSDIKKSLSRAGVDDFDLEKSKTRSVEVNCNFDTKKVDPNLLVGYIKKVLLYHDRNKVGSTFSSDKVIITNLEDPMSKNYYVTDSVLHKESNFSFKIYNKTEQLKNTGAIELDQNVLRIEIKFKGSYLAKTAVGEWINGLFDNFEDLSELYMKHTKERLIDKITSFQDELENSIIRRLENGEGLTSIYRHYKLYIIDSKNIEKPLCKYLESMGVKEAEKEAKKKIKELKKKNKELKELKGTQNILDEIIEFFTS